MMPRELPGERTLFGIVVFCVFSSKIILSSSDINSAAGVRIDDFLILWSGLFLFRNGYLGKIRISRPIKFYLFFVAVNLFSAIWNGFSGRVPMLTSLLFSVRMLEYLVFYYIGNVMAKNRRSFERPLHWYIVMLAVVVPLQMLGVLPTTGNFAGSLQRAIGNTNGPYELAAVSAFLVCYLGYIYRERMKTACSLGFLLLTASRITLIGVLLSGTLWLFRRTQSKKKLLMAFGGAVVSVALLIAAIPVVSGLSPQDLTIIRRLTSSNPAEMQSKFQLLYSLAPVAVDSDQYKRNTLDPSNSNAHNDSSLNGDVSGAIRMYRWTCLIKSTLDNWDSTWIGMGPSFASTAVDGYYTRTFTESGLIGLTSFLAFALVVLRDKQPGCWAFRQYALVMFVTCMFIDIFVSYKPMLFFWLWHGMNNYWAENPEIVSPGLAAERAELKA
jgi:hypothetical protein